MRLLLPVLTLGLLASPTACPAAKPLSQRERAIEITAELHATGQRYEGRHITLWVAHDRLDDASARAFLAQLDRGVEVVREHLATNVDEPRHPRRLEMYLSPRVGTSHVRGDVPPMIYIPTRRVRNRTAPYLHEIVHAVASWSWRHSEWLGEGLANHVATAVEPASGGYHPSAVLPTRLDGLPRYLCLPDAKRMLPLVGPRGRRSSYTPELEALFKDMMANRPNLAPPFYAQSWSCVDFLEARVGIDGLHAHASATEGTLDMAALKRDWLAQATPAPSVCASHYL